MMMLVPWSRESTENRNTASNGSTRTVPREPAAAAAAAVRERKEDLVVQQNNGTSQPPPHERNYTLGLLAPSVVSGQIAKDENNRRQ